MNHAIAEDEQALPSDFGITTHLDAIRRALGPVDGLAMLDVGCGESSLPRDLAALGADCTGVDPFMPARGWTAADRGRWRILQASAASLPIDDAAVDVVTFIYSLHHVPGALLGPALGEVRRVLKPGGRLYVAEPLPEGDFDALISLFHDEAAVRADAQLALADARQHFGRHRHSGYVSRRRYADFDGFARPMTANTRFNSYSADDVVAPAVRARFDAVTARTGGIFDQPVRVDLLG